MDWFGEPYPSREKAAPIFTVGDEVRTPVGEPCLYCDGPIFPGERGFIMPFLGAVDDPVTMRAEHYECFLRQIFGSAAHQARRCHCYGGVEGDDDGELTRRGSALLAFAEFEGKTRE